MILRPLLITVLIVLYSENDTAWLPVVVVVVVVVVEVPIDTVVVAATDVGIV